MSFISNDNVVAVAVAADPPPQGPPAQILMRSQDEFQDQNRAPALHPPAPAKRQRTTDQDVSAADAADAADAAVRVVEVAAAGKEQAASVDDCAAGNECPM